MRIAGLRGMKKAFFVSLWGMVLLLAAGLMLTGERSARAQGELTPTPTPTLTVEPLEEASNPAETPWPMVIPLIDSQPTPVGFGPDEYPYEMNPLTGQVPVDLANLERRPMVIKITNYPRTVRPQSGLSRADHVYEYYMERGISRFIAVFYGQDASKVGPVRSGRFFDEHIFKMYDGFFIFGSADPRIMSYFLDLDWHWVSSLVLDPEDKLHSCADGPRFMCRDFEMETYNNYFANTDAMESYLTRRNGNYRPNLNGMRFEERTPPGGGQADSIHVRYSLFIYAKWDYQPERQKYIRYEETVGFADPKRESFEPHIDKLTGEQISADNVVVLVVPHFYYIKTITTETLTIPLVGEGQAFFFRDGKAYQGSWERWHEYEVLRLYKENGEPYSLKPGNTWFQVISPDSVLSFVGNDWYYAFSPPEVPEDLQFNPINPDAHFPPYGWYRDEVPEYKD